ncbi:hypothetical protein [Tsukamurella sp. 1534]|uniref:hypothetical protein n=1 Tax=Tsukamurella sp. 1534 TaxID=1151061 RepID=UPI0002D4D6D6|nr:hypothetical protein [Tsukamurella sp. 1534]
MTAPDGRRYNGASADARRAERRARFLDAALTVAARDGAAAVSARSLCAESGLHARYFRESFDAAGQALGEAFDEVIAELMRTVGEQIAAVPADAPDPIAARVRAGVRASFAALEDDPRRGVLLTGADGVPELLARREALVDTLAAAMAAQALEILDDPPTPGEALLSARLTAMGAVALGVATRTGRVAASNREVEEIIVASILGNRNLKDTLRLVRGVDAPL